ncbi:MAG TPA: MFS transporter, partial [Thermomicrobiales bacterium]|nr:MFS transporter [Thermomicrobiales bacterium]
MRFRSAPQVGRPGKLRAPSTFNLRDLQLPDALKSVPFRRYWLSQIVALAGTWMQNVGMQLVVLSLTTSAFAIGAINVAAALPMLLFSLYGGVLADRFDRRKIIIITLALLGGVSGIYAFLIGTDRIEYWHILALAALAGVINSFELPAAQAYVSELVPKKDLPQAIALNSASFNSTRIVGPAIAASVISVIGLAGAFIVNIITLIAPIGTLIGLKRIMKPRQRAAMSNSGISALKDGLRYVRSEEGTMGLILLQGLISFFVSPNLLVLLALYTTDVLGGSEGWVGWMLSALGIGSLTGALVLLRGSRLESAAARRMVIALFGLCIGMGWLGISQNVWMAVPGVMVAGYAFSSGNSQLSTRLQQTAPDELRGRVMSLNMLAFNGVMPFSTLLVSALAEVFGQPAILVASA